MLCLNGFELYSRWVPLKNRQTRVLLDVCPIRYFARITFGKILVDNFIIGRKCDFLLFPEIVNRQNSGMSLSSWYTNIAY